ncbi:MAG: hypothetical protein E6R03_07895 [Hyphomicrobiaceae bacterium]|nr:MAG: hypothetical protein E6R03_07895 [Hyphomicrobiaceae bacterium]
MNAFHHLKRDLIDGARFNLTVDSMTTRVLVEAIRSFQMARGHLRSELIGKDAAFDISWRRSCRYDTDWKNPIQARVEDGVLYATFGFENEDQYGGTYKYEEEFSVPVFEILAFFDGGNAWKKRVRDDLVAAVDREVERLAADLELKRAALVRIKETDVSA